MATEISALPSIERRAAEQSLLDRVNDIERNGMVLGVLEAARFLRLSGQHELATQLVANRHAIVAQRWTLEPMA